MQVYYINLARRTDRRAFMEAQFARLGLQATRIEAIAANDLGPEMRAKYSNPDALFYVTPGDLACAMSHAIAYRQFLQSQAPYALVLEDDALLSGRLPSFLVAFEAAAPLGDIVRIETSGRGIRVKDVAARIDNIEMARPYTHEGGAAGYIVGRRAAALLLETDATRRRSFDLALFDPYGLLGRDLDRLQTLAGLCIQAHLADPGAAPNLGSDLHGTARASKSSQKKLARRLWGFWDREVVAGSQRTFHQLLGARRRSIPFLP